MTGIENRIEFQQGPRMVYKALSDLRNVPKYLPGVLDSEIVHLTPEGVGTRLTLLTRDRTPVGAYVTQEADRHFLCVQDERGVAYEMELARTPQGTTLVTSRIVGQWPQERVETLRREAREKLYAFRDAMESGLGGGYSTRA